MAYIDWDVLDGVGVDWVEGQFLFVMHLFSVFCLSSIFAFFHYPLFSSLSPYMRARAKK